MMVLEWWNQDAYSLLYILYVQFYKVINFMFKSK